MKVAQSCPTLCDPWTIQSMEFSSPEYWSRWPFPSPGDHSNPGIEPRSPTLQADSLPAEPPRRPIIIVFISLLLEVHQYSCIIIILYSCLSNQVREEISKKCIYIMLYIYLCVVDRIMTPQRCSCLFLKTCDYVRLYNKEKLRL